MQPPEPAPQSSNAEQSVPTAQSNPAHLATEGTAAGRVVPDYELLQRIGAGAYGEVWLARSVLGALRAVKVIHRGRFNDQRPFDREFEGIQRFEPISRSHPSQLAILHVGKNEGAGCFYYVMELADAVSSQGSGFNVQSSKFTDAGQEPRTLNLELRTLNSTGYLPHTLRHDLEQHGRLPIADCVQIGLSLTTALAHLHQHGLVHRDIKPSNVIYVNGVPKLGDIGLVTEAGDTQSIVGTEGYLPPEGPGTPQADIFSLGKVLYEISTGMDRRRFAELPEDLREWPDRRAVVEFNEILLKACAKDPARRYGSADEMQRDLTRLQRGRSLRRQRAWEQATHWAKRLAPVAALISVAAAFFWSRFNDSTIQRFNPSAPTSIFVLPFRNDGTNQVEDLLCSRISDALRAGLAEIDGVKVGPPKSGWVDRDETKLRRELRQKFGSRYALSGKVRASTNELAVTVTVHDTTGDRVLWSESFSSPLAERVELEERIIRVAAERLSLEISADAGQRIKQKLQNNLKAFEAYQESRRHRNELISTFATDAIERLTHAIELDPNFAEAQMALSFTYRLLAYYDREPKQCMPLVGKHARDALAIDDTYPGVKSWLIGLKIIYDFDWPGALEDFHSVYGDGSVSGDTQKAWILRSLGRLGEARAEYAVNMKVSPPWGSLPEQTFEQFLLDGEFGRVIALCQDLAQKQPDRPEWPLCLGRCFHRMGNLEQALTTLEELRLRWNPPVVLAELGMVYARLGRRDDALGTLRKMDEQAGNRYVAPYFRAQVYAALGDTDQALDHLNKACEDQCEHLVNADSWGLRTDPSWKDLQNHPRFQALLKKVGLDVWPK